MLSSVEQAFVGRDEKRAPLKTPAWEATCLLDYCVISRILSRTNHESGKVGQFTCKLCDSTSHAGFSQYNNSNLNV